MTRLAAAALAALVSVLNAGTAYAWAHSCDFGPPYVPTDPWNPTARVHVNISALDYANWPVWDIVICHWGTGYERCEQRWYETYPDETVRIWFVGNAYPGRFMHGSDFWMTRVYQDPQQGPIWQYEPYPPNRIFCEGQIAPNGP
jgi:hypothetical protein